MQMRLGRVVFVGIVFVALKVGMLLFILLFMKEKLVNEEYEVLVVVLGFL